MRRCAGDAGMRTSALPPPSSCLSQNTSGQLRTWVNIKTNRSAGRSRRKSLHVSFSADQEAVSHKGTFVLNKNQVPVLHSFLPSFFVLIFLPILLRAANTSPDLVGGEETGLCPKDGGNYRQRLITTSGGNDAAPNEIFIKDPSASN